MLVSLYLTHLAADQVYKMTLVCTHTALSLDKQCTIFVHPAKYGHLPVPRQVCVLHLRQAQDLQRHHIQDSTPLVGSMALPDA